MDDPSMNVQQPPQQAPATSPTSQTNQPNVDQTRRPDKKDDKFSKLMNKDDEEKAGSAVSSLDDDSSSIFALSRSSGTKKKKEAANEDKSLSTGQTRSDISGLGEDDMSMTDTDEDGKNKGNTMDFSQESRSDLFQLISSNTAQVQGTAFAEKMNESSSLSRAEAFDLARQMIEKITLMKTQGETTTTVTLQYPPLFQGAQVLVKQFTTAPGEFNLTFQNLTAQAQQMMDMKTSREALLQTLQEKGYNVHIIVTTQDVEKPEYKQDLNPQNQQQQQQGGQQQQPGSGKQ